MTLRPYQAAMLDEARALMRDGCKQILIESPTGSGKTMLTAEMMNGIKERNKSAWFMMHRRELVEQTANTFKRIGLPFGIVAAGMHCGESEPIKICSIGTMTRRDDAPPDMIAWDEAHHVASTSWSEIMRRANDSYHIGLSATPVRAGGKTLGKWFKRIVHGPSVRWLIDNGWLSEYEYYAPDVPDLSAVRLVGSDYDPEQISAIMMGRALVGNVVDHWKRHASGLLSIGFAPTIKASKAYVEAFKAAGIRAAHLDGDTHKDERREATMALARRELDVLWNCGLFSEGYDLSAAAGMDVSIECVLKCDPTKSIVKSKQQDGRALRMKPKPAVILDHAGNWTRHGIPDDRIIWSLESKPRRQVQSGTSIPVTQCANCNRVFRPTATCPYCGDTRPAASRPLQYMDGELKEIEREQREIDAHAEMKRKKEARMEEGRCRSLRDLQELAKRRGYSPGWAFMRWKARNGSR